MCHIYAVLCVSLGIILYYISSMQLTCNNCSLDLILYCYIPIDLRPSK